MSADDEQRQLAVRVLRNVDETEREELKNWAAKLLALRRSDYSSVRKAKEALLLTKRANIIVPVLRVVAKELGLDKLKIDWTDPRSLGQVLSWVAGLWRDRSLAAKVGIGASTLAFAIFGSQGAGIAALGTAVGVPLWVVFGAGATFAAVIYEEITGVKPDPSTTYTIFEAKKTEKEGIANSLLKRVRGPGRN